MNNKTRKLIYCDLEKIDYKEAWDLQKAIHQLRVENKIDDVVEAVVSQKSKYVKDVCNELKLDFEKNYSIIFRVYDNGCAYRFVTSFDGEQQVYSDNVVLNFKKNYKAYFPEVEEDLISHFESAFEYTDLNSIPSEKVGQPPFLIEADNGVKVAITETAVYNYPCMFIKRTGENTLTGYFPKAVLEVEDADDRNEIIKKEADYIAEVKGTRAFPWRILMVSQQDKELLENQMVFLLSDPNKLKDTDWIKPGKVAWDWWNANNVFGVDFESGLNTETYKYFIDFASKFHLD